MASALARLGDAYWDFVLRAAPQTATFVGEHRYDDRLPRIGPASVAAQEAELRGILRAARALPARLPEADAATRDILVHLANADLQERKHRFHLWNVDQMYGPQVWFLEMLNYHPLETPAQVDQLASRFAEFPAFVDAYVGNLRQGVRENRTAPRIAVERVAAQVKAHLAAPDSLFLPPRKGFRSAEVEALVRDAVRPAFARLHEFLANEYLPRSRASKVGVWATRGGDEAYAWRVKYHTTTDLSPDEIHRIGLEEIASIEDEMRVILGRIGHRGDIASFFRRVKADPSMRWRSRGQIVRHFERILAKATAALPRWFHLLPRTRCIVKPIEAYREKDCVAAFYYQPPEDLSRPGIFYANTYDPASRPRLNNAALTIHEAVPGHHLQVALSVEMKGLPAFRRNGSFTAFIEGWALYAERLGVEMGLYEDDLERFGMLTYQAWRAARLVVDTGLHAKRWTRERAIGYFREHLALGDTEILNEVDRYIIWPGQALAYMIGKREIWRLREEAKRALGARFDIRAFHDVVLRQAAVPLKTLEANVKAWISRGR